MIATQNRTDLHTTEHPKHLPIQSDERAVPGLFSGDRWCILPQIPTLRAQVQAARQPPADEHGDTSISQEDLDHRKLYNMGDIAMDTQELERDRQQKYQRMRVTCECLQQSQRKGKFVTLTAGSSLKALKVIASTTFRATVFNAFSDNQAVKVTNLPFRVIKCPHRYFLKPLNTFALFHLSKPRPAFCCRDPEPLPRVSFFPFPHCYLSCLRFFSSMATTRRSCISCLILILELHTHQDGFVRCLPNISPCKPRQSNIHNMYMNIPIPMNTYGSHNVFRIPHVFISRHFKPTHHLVIMSYLVCISPPNMYCNNRIDDLYDVTMP